MPPLAGRLPRNKQCGVITLSASRDGAPVSRQRVEWQAAGPARSINTGATLAGREVNLCLLGPAAACCVAPRRRAKLCRSISERSTKRARTRGRGSKLCYESCLLGCQSTGRVLMAGRKGQILGRSAPAIIHSIKETQTGKTHVMCAHRFSTRLVIKPSERTGEGVSINAS